MVALHLLPAPLAVCQLAADAPQPDWARLGDLLVFLRTPDELTVVCAQQSVPPEVRSESGWRALKVGGPLAFSEVGVLAGLAVPLAEAGVSIFALSTYDTDYILVRESALAGAIAALQAAGYTITGI